MTRIRRSDCTGPGIERVRTGRGFAYRHPDGSEVDDLALLERIEGLVLPPAWEQVWICPSPDGHIQALGTDAAGRRQYRYHERWRARRDGEKFDRMLDFARALPRLRRRVAADLALPGLGRDRVLACALRLVDVGLFRVGGEEYAAEHETFGVATLRREHVRIRRDGLLFDYPAKSHKERIVLVEDPDAVAVVTALKRRRSTGDDLLAYRDGRRWVDVRSADVNAYLKDAAAGDFSAKDFRTWTATVLAAVALAGREGVARTDAARRRLVSSAVREVAESLGNTPAVCRASYIDPRVIDRFEAGETISGALRNLDAADVRLRPRIERKVLELLDDPAPRARRRETARTQARR